MSKQSPTPPQLTEEQVWDGIEVVSMDGFTGYASAVAETLPEAVTVMDPFHVVHLAADKLTLCMQRVQRVQREQHGRRGKKGDPLFQTRKTLLTRRSLLNAKQKERIEQLWASGRELVALEVTWLVYQDIIAAYADKDKRRGKKLMKTVMRRIKTGVPAADSG